MKYGILIIAFLAMSFQGFSQNDAITKYFNQYVEDTSFTVVYISPKMFGMIAKLSEDEVEEDVQQVIKDLKGLRVLMKDDSDGIGYYNEAVKTLDLKSYEELMTVRNGEQNVRFVVKDNGDIIEELLLLVGSPEEFIMISFVGKIDLDKIAKLAKTADIEGLEHLEKVGSHQ
ncbi:MAG: hypothetical protein ACI97N_000338 [Cognaticolwellia sp.]|jgi:hypothetical protein|tara:strand:+ start:259 stop:774 length:516 start_codon:yes stop_codon:yes gene_type:complete